MTKTLDDLFGQWLAQRALIAEMDRPTDAKLNAECDRLCELEQELLDRPAASVDDVWAKVLIVVDHPGDDRAERPLREQAYSALRVQERFAREWEALWSGVEGQEEAA